MIPTTRPRISSKTTNLSLECTNSNILFAKILFTKLGQQTSKNATAFNSSSDSQLKPNKQLPYSSARLSYLCFIYCHDKRLTQKLLGKFVIIERFEAYLTIISWIQWVSIGSSMSYPIALKLFENNCFHQKGIWQQVSNCFLVLSNLISKP